MDPTSLTRRGALTGASVGAALPVLAACGGDDPGQASDPAPSPAPTEDATRTERPDERPPARRKPRGIAEVADVPVGGGIILAEHRLVVTRPRTGEVKGFTAVCTHQGCLVEQVTDTINCPCHGSRFSIDDGSVVDGPAPDPLAERRLVVDRGVINAAEE